MTAIEALALAHAEGVLVSLAGDFIRYQSHGEPPPHVLAALRAEERRAIVMWINDHFKSSAPGRCAHCGDDSRVGDPFVTIFVCKDRADVHASCHPAWVAEREAEARVALGIETPVGIRPERDASCIETRAK